MVDGSIFARVHVLVICDEVEQRLGEDVFDLSGVRTQILAPSFPYVHPELCVFLQVSGHEGAASGEIVVVNGATDEEISHIAIEEFQLSGPLEFIPAWFRIQHCEFPEPGIYWVQVFLNSKLVAERRFHIVASPGDTNGRPTR